MFSRRGPLGGFAFGERLPSSVMNDVTLDLSNAVDGVGGGTYAPSNPIVIGGDGLSVTGALTSTGTVSFTGSSITLGNSSTDQLNINAEVTFHQDIEFNNDVQLGTDSADNITVGGNLTCERLAEFDAGLNASADSTIDAELNVTGNLQTGGSIDVDESVTVGNFLTVNGNTTLGNSSSDAVAIRGSISTVVAFTGSGRIKLRHGTLPNSNATIEPEDGNCFHIPADITGARTYTLGNDADAGDFMLFYQGTGSSNTTPFGVNFAVTDGGGGGDTNTFNPGTNSRTLLFIHDGSHWIKALRIDNSS